MLIGLFWEVEQSAIFKPLPSLKAALAEPTMRKATGNVYAALKDFDAEFERLIRRDTHAKSAKPTTLKS